MRNLRVPNLISKEESKSIEKIVKHASREERLSAEEELELTQRVKAGDQEALERLARANFRYVVSVAKQYLNEGLTLADLVYEGNVGIVRAAKRFDESRGFTFISYAMWWIRQSILQAITENSSIVRLPSDLQPVAVKLRTEIVKLELGV